MYYIVLLQCADKKVKNMDIQIYMNQDRDEYAIACGGNQVMRAQSRIGIRYPVLEGEYEITAASDIAFIDEEIQDLLELHWGYIQNCCEDGAMLEGCNCLVAIEKDEMHGEIVLYAGDIEIGMISVCHTECA